jgi:hypothetical protein
MCRDCQQCQCGNVHKQPEAPLHVIFVPSRRFSHEHVDLVGALPASLEGNVYLLTAVDRSTRWVEAVPLRKMEASPCTNVFIPHWVARFWRAGHCHDRQRHPIYLCCVDFYLHMVGHQAHTHNCLPP